MKNTNSIRWRLPFSYAAIALLAAVSLGVILLLILRGYYQRQEQDYLRRNAQAIGSQIAPSLREGLPQAALQSQLEGYAFLTQTRLRLFDAQGLLLADTEQLDQDTLATLSIQVEVGGVSQAFSQTLQEGSPAVSYRSVIVVKDDQGQSVLVTKDQVSGSDPLISEIPVAATPYGFGLGWTADGSSPRSAQRIEQPVAALDGEKRLGTIELSEGPSYGRAVVWNVAWGWAAASALAVLLAAAAGAWISRWINLPLLELAAATRRMVAGDLSARADARRKDELGALAEVFNEMARQIEETILALRRFVSDAAHEIQTPLTVLHSDLDLIRAPLQDPEQIERIERAKTQVVRLEAVSSGLLELSRAEARAGENRPVSLNKIVFESSELFASRAEQEGLGYSLDLPEAEITVLGDETQLRHALDNLLDNAVKFNREGGTVRVSLRSFEGWAELRVADTGISIPGSELPSIFRRFYRGRNAGDTPGSGLGLAIVKAVVEGHRGVVNLESGEEGTTAIVRLPVSSR